MFSRCYRQFLFCRNHLSRLTGFSLIEMLVVVTIFLIMTGVLMANFPAFRDKVTLDLIAQEIAITIRQAQVYGIGTRAAGSTGDDFRSHGIYFNLPGLGNKLFYLYADLNGNKSFNDGIDSVVEQFAIRGAAEITSLCAGSGSDCISSDTLNILFQRSYPEAELGSGVSYVQVVVKSTHTGNQRTIQVRTTGQIVVTNP